MPTLAAPAGCAGDFFFWRNRWGFLVMHFLNIDVSVGRILAVVAAAATLGLGAIDDAAAADRTITPQTEVFSCGSSVKPGDTLTLPAGVRGPLTIRDCNGTASNPIVIRNQAGGSGPAVIRRSGGSGGFIFSCINCVGVVIDGGGKWKGAPSGKSYGIQVTVGGGSPSAFVRISGLSRSLTIRNLEVDGAGSKNGSGIRVNDLTVKRSRHSGMWRENILIEDNFIHDVSREGMYVGSNYNDGSLPLRNIEIRNNRLEDIGWEAINAKSMWEGKNSIHHNEVLRAGKNSGSTKKAQFTGINAISSSVSIYNNWIDTTGEHGIQVWTDGGPKASEKRGPFDAEIYNNVVVNAGALWKSSMLKTAGINVGAGSGTEKPNPRIYSNTIVQSRKAAISVNANVGSGFVRDNIIAGAGGNPVVTAPKYVSLVNNRVGSVAQMDFVDSGRKNFRLKTTSPARNQGSSSFPSHDFDNVARPKGGSADQGAFEASN
jgi:hypothetical protein